MNNNLHNVNAILLLDKSLNDSSNFALQKVKRFYGASKAGHAGSLDPLATGMLPICFGNALKFIEFLLGSDKQYQVTGKLGITTNTGDKEGEIITQRDTQYVTLAMIEKVIQQFHGAQQQIPPMFSALKHQGQPLYKLARQGKIIERKPRDIVIHHIQLLNYTSDTFTLDVSCSSGTYIRTLIQDIGEALQCGANVEALRRSHVAHYQATQMVTLSELEQSTNREQYLLPMETILEYMRGIHLSEAQSIALTQGKKLVLSEEIATGIIKLINPAGNLFGVGEILAGNVLAPRKICPTPIAA